MCGDGGRDSAEAADLLAAAGFSQVSRMEGGYAAYCEVCSRVCRVCSSTHAPSRGASAAGPGFKHEHEPHLHPRPANQPTSLPHTLVTLVCRCGPPAASGGRPRGGGSAQVRSLAGKPASCLCGPAAASTTRPHKLALPCANPRLLCCLYCLCCCRQGGTEERAEHSRRG